MAGSKRRAYRQTADITTDMLDAGRTVSAHRPAGQIGRRGSRGGAGRGSTWTVTADALPAPLIKLQVIHIGRGCPLEAVTD